MGSFKLKRDISIFRYFELKHLAQSVAIRTVTIITAIVREYEPIHSVTDFLFLKKKCEHVYKKVLSADFEHT